MVVITLLKKTKQFALINTAQFSTCLDRHYWHRNLCVVFVFMHQEQNSECFVVLIKLTEGKTTQKA